MPVSTRRGTPRATRLMVDVLHAIAGCGDLVRYWDVAKRGEGRVLVRLISGQRFPSEDAAVAAAHEIVARVQPIGHALQVVSAVGRPSSRPEAEWLAFVEIQVG